MLFHRYGKGIRMNRKIFYTCSLIGFFLMWGVFGFMAAAPRGEPGLQATVLPVENTEVAPGVTPNAAIAVTGEAQSVPGILFVYFLFGLGALCLILALLNAANKQTALYAHRKRPSDES